MLKMKMIHLNVFIKNALLMNQWIMFAFWKEIKKLNTKKLSQTCVAFSTKNVTEFDRNQPGKKFDDGASQSFIYCS